MHTETRYKLAARREMRRYRVAKLLVTLEIDVSTYSDEELKAAQAGFSTHTISEYQAEEVANVFNVDGDEMWLDHLTGSDLFLKFDQTRVMNAYWVE